MPEQRRAAEETAAGTPTTPQAAQAARAERTVRAVGGQPSPSSAGPAPEPAAGPTDGPTPRRTATPSEPAAPAAARPTAAQAAAAQAATTPPGPTSPAAPGRTPGPTAPGPAAPAAARPTTAQAAATRWIWLAAWPITAVFVLSNAATPLYVLWQRRLGFSKGTLTVVFAFYIVGLLGSLLVSGVASDRLGRKPVLLPALGLALAACAVFATAGSVAALIIARLFTGIAVGAVVSAGMAAVSDVAGPDRRRLGALLASCAMVLGAGLGPFLAGVLSEEAPAPTVTVFVVEAVLLASAVLVVLRMPVRRPDAAAAPRSWVRLPSVPRESRTRLALGIAVFGPGITATSFVLSLGPSLLSGLLGTSSRVLAGVMAFVMFLAAAGVQFAVSRLDRYVILRAGAVSTVLAAGVLTLAVHAGSVAALFGAAVLAGAGQGLGQLGGLSLLNSAVPARRLAEANAALNMGGYLLAGTLPVSAGYLADAVGLTTGTTVFAATLAALGLAGAAMLLRRPRQPGNSAASVRDLPDGA